ncbi:MAG: AAA family ATPase [Clostridia bacterium]|nr:AAA family ATPase [Clostridia bacterium]
MTMSPVSNNDYPLERDMLAAVATQIDKNLEEIEERRRTVWECSASREVAENLYNMLNEQQKGLKKVSATPYFARIDFEKTSGVERYYIGKHTVFNGADIMVLDWRAPLSSLYYDGNIGPASYECPDGTIEGNILLKRQFDIKDRILISYADMDICSNDELLRVSLAEASDVRLRNIVATIQAEQNAVIRKELKKNVIVQGVAGSGKTTVALHRIAYLIYTYAKQLTTEKILILAPNKFFLDYISDTLPDLGVENIQQETYEDFGLGILDSNVQVVPYNEDLKRVIDSSALVDEQTVMGFKTSMIFAQIVEKYLENFEKAIADQIEDFSIDGHVVVNKESIKRMFTQYADMLSTSERIQKVKNFLLKTIKELAQIYETGAYSFNPNITSDVCEKAKKEGKKLVSSYLQLFKLKDVLSHMKLLLTQKEYFSEYLTPAQYKFMKDSFASKLKQKKISYEDMPALLLMYHRFFGEKIQSDLKHIVVDEAQDLGVFHFYVLRKMFKNSTMTILGDIAQGIYSYRGIDDWNKLNAEVFEGNAEFIPLVQSYRTSVEVMEEANKVAEKMRSQLGISLAKSVLRHGEKVNYINADSQECEINLIVARIKELQKENRKNIAVIAKDDERAQKVYSRLKNQFDAVNLIDNSTDRYLAGITVLPVYLSKGLEFDSVLLVDADETCYGEDTLHAKLLYVAITRAMHTLDIYYVNPLTKWLR